MAASGIDEIAPASRKILMAVAQRLSSRLPDLLEEVVGLIIAREGAYGARGIVAAEELRRAAWNNIVAVFDVLSGKEVDPTEEVSASRATGRRRAQQGVPLESVLRAYRLGTQVVMRAILDEGQQNPPDELAAFLEGTTFVLEVADRHSQAVVEGYRWTEAELQRRDSRRQQAMFGALLEGHGGDPAVVAEAVSVLGLPAHGPYVVVVSSLDLAAEDTLGSVRDACAVYAFPAAWRAQADREIGIVALGTAPASRLLDILRGAAVGSVGVSAVFDSLREVPVAHRLAEVALLTVPPDSRDVAWIEERLAESLVVSTPDLAWRLSMRTLGTVLALEQPERDILLKTLAVWYESGGSTATTAAQLYCHRNTVSNRLRRFESLTGRSLTDHRDLLACHLALLGLRLLPTADPSLSE